MILTKKYQCKMCKHYGSVRGFPGNCCIALSKDDERTHFEKIPKRSNCWCSGQEPNGRKPKESWKPFLELGQYLTEHYGYNTIMNPTAYGSRKKLWSVEVTAERVKFPLTIVFSMDHRKGSYTVEDMKQILKAYEREDKSNEEEKEKS